MINHAKMWMVVAAGLVLAGCSGTPYGYKSADVTPQAEAGKITIPMTGENKAAYYEVKFE